ncbi:hypothetical protein RhiirA4_548668 [Rhizophagus irregularis]|uniref:Uncharacterized protein n=1 Tax=Rhizophagus irregularis TaxID=588596 RepID=A0A2I1H8U1_9GLOM|nr:hypothetical protein RhiirA4_548668 [Rhizophagus irregularis]
MPSTSNNNPSSRTQPKDNVYSGVNDKGNVWYHRGDSVAPGGSYYYANKDNSYYYQNSNGSKYYNNGKDNAMAYKIMPILGQEIENFNIVTN